MDDLEQILISHGARYPKMRPTDAVKLIYQNEFGGGHLIADRQSCLAYLRREYEATPPDPSMPLTEDIGNGIVRVMLAAMDGSGYPIDSLGRDFIASSAAHRGQLSQFLQKLALLRRVTKAGHFGFSPEELEDYLAAYADSGYPAVSHSPEYREAYRPAYRIVLRRLLPEALR